MVLLKHGIGAAALVALALLTGCGDSTDDGGAMAAKPSAAKTTTAIKIADFVYDPTPATVKAGARIAIRNADAAPHTITDGGSGKAFDSGTIKGKASGSLTISEPGTYKYICEFHPFMKGEITVVK